MFTWQNKLSNDKQKYFDLFPGGRHHYNRNSASSLTA